jgi:hypothetical protein
LKEDVYPEDRVDGCGRCLFGKLVVVFVRAHRVECKEKRKEKAVGVPAHGEGVLETRE